jgi:hypothetical protein
MCAEQTAKLKDEAKTIDRLISLWVQQNTLLWSRLQTLATLQTAVFGGWYFFWRDNNFTVGLLVGLLGVVLSALMLELINCDASRRQYLKNKVGDIDRAGGQVIFPPGAHRLIRGVNVMTIIIWMFLLIDVAVVILAIVKLACR